MTKTFATTIGLGSLMFNWWVIPLHSALFGFFYDTHHAASMVRLVLAVAVLLYAWLPFTRFVLTRAIIAATGMLLVTVGLGSLATSQLFGVSYYMLPIDMFLSVEWGIISMIVAFELPVHHVNLYQHYIRPLAVRSLARNPETSQSLPSLTTAKS